MLPFSLTALRVVFVLIFRSLHLWVLPRIFSGLPCIKFHLYFLLFFSKTFLTWIICKVFTEFCCNLASVVYILVVWAWGMWDLSFWGIEPATPYTARWSFNHWTTEGVPPLFSRIFGFVSFAEIRKLSGIISSNTLSSLLCFNSLPS